MSDDIATMDATARRVADIYADAESHLIGRAAAAVKRGLGHADDPKVIAEAKMGREEPLHRALLNEMTALKDDARKTATALDEWSKTALPNTVREGADLGSRSVGRSLAPLNPGMNISSRRAVNTHAVEALSRELYVKSNALHRNIIRNIEDDYRTVVSDIVGRAVTGSATREEAAQFALNKFAEQGVRGFTDKAGRQWNISSYVEMATRSATMRALTEGTVARLAEKGLDFLRVSTHKNCAPQCEPFQGKILSASGDYIGKVTAESELDGSDTVFHVVNSLEGAKARGFQHPGCRHTVSAYIPGTRQTTPQVQVDPEGYRNTQELRRLEREVRKARREEAAALGPGDAAAAKRKIAEGRKRIAEHVDATGVVREPKRERISGVFGRGDSKKAPASLPKISPAKPNTPSIFTEDEGRRGGHAIWHDYADKLDAPTADDVRKYTGTGFKTINGPLRIDADLTAEARATARSLDRAIEDAPRVPEAIRVSRDVGASVYGLTGGSDITTLVGQSFRDEGFMSTAMRSALPADGLGTLVNELVELRLDVPEGTKALYVSSHPKGQRGLGAYGPEENELILGRGVGYEIYDSFIEDGKRVLLARITSQQPSKGVL
ncbi:hypothetical protein BJD99_00990 [Rhodococcus sp. 1163]|uniref:phage minor capsid protein n=1 Tax=Rhodococcus sp. 1163 TaxID=1905289 RepID=UPI000A077F41|nr:phage minor capsid protein [Rhodococcus sp. 1163]ORI11747.1 hypothetical protein BJD99_00990 [Rhodococcus sp. 1163]